MQTVLVVVADDRHLSGDHGALVEALKPGVTGTDEPRGNGLPDLLQVTRGSGIARLILRSGPGIANVVALDPSDVPTDPMEFEPAGPQTPLLPWDHPDLVLAAAVRAAVVDTDEAAMIATTRLEGIPVEVAATWRGITPQLASQWRKQAETKLVEAIHTGELTGITTPARAAEDRDQQARRNGVNPRQPARPRTPRPTPHVHNRRAAPAAGAARPSRPPSPDPP